MDVDCSFSYFARCLTDSLSESQTLRDPLTCVLILSSVTLVQTLRAHAIVAMPRLRQNKNCIAYSSSAETLVSQDAVVLIRLMRLLLLRTRILARLQILRPTCQLLVVSSHGGRRSCHHSYPNIRPYCRARKYLHSDAQWVNVPKDVVEDLITASRSAILTSTDSLKQVNGCFAMPRVMVQSLVEVIDACVEGIPFVPMDDANRQARGLGSMVAFWKRMRNICPDRNCLEQCGTGKKNNFTELSD